MLGWAVRFFVVALVAALVGFGEYAGAAAGLARVLFWGVSTLFLLSLLSSFFVTGKRTLAP
jgi:uncharacterized membrane protein YtjA (UPF0391 family)